MRRLVALLEGMAARRALAEPLAAGPTSSALRLSPSLRPLRDDAPAARTRKGQEAQGGRRRAAEPEESPDVRARGEARARRSVRASGTVPRPLPRDGTRREPPRRSQG